MRQDTKDTKDTDNIKQGKMMYMASLSKWLIGLLYITVYSIFTVRYHWDDLDLSDGPLDMVNKQLLQMQSPGTLQLVKLLCVVRPCL